MEGVKQLAIVPEALGLYKHGDRMRNDTVKHRHRRGSVLEAHEMEKQGAA